MNPTPITRPENHGDETVNTGIETSDDRYRLLVPVRGYGITDSLTQAVRTAAEIVRGQDRTGELLVLCLVPLSEQTPLDRDDIEDQRFRKADDTATQLVQVSEEVGITAAKTVRPTHDEAPTIQQSVATERCDGVFITTQEEQSEQPSVLGRQAAVELDTQIESDVFFRKLGTEPKAVERIFLAVGGGPHSALATECARALALTCDAAVDITHIYAEEATTDLTEATHILQRAEDKLSGIDLIETGLLPSNRAAEEIVERSRRYEVTVLGAPTAAPLRELVFGTVVNGNENSQATNGVLMARQGIKKHR